MIARFHAPGRAGGHPALRADALMLGLGLVGLVGFHRTVFFSGFDRLPGDQGDARAHVYLAEHWYQALRGQASLLSPGMFYPIPGTLGYTDPMPAHAVPFVALRAAGLDMFAALTVTVVLFSLLNYVACVFLLRRVLGLNATASSVGALFFAFNSPRVSHAGHFNLLPAFFLPLAIACVVRFVRDSAGMSQRTAFWWLSGAALCLNLQLLTSLYQGWFFTVWAVLLLVLAAAVSTSRRLLLALVARFWPAMVGGAAVFLLGLLPLAAIFVPVARLMGPRSYGLVWNLIPEGWSLLQMGSGNYVWGAVSDALSRIHPLPSTEHNIGIGVVGSATWLALTAWAVVKASRAAAGGGARGPDAGVGDLFLSLMILATTLFYLVGMKYWGGGSPWRLFYLLVPGAGSLRGVARYVMVLALPMAIAFAVVVHRSMQRISAQDSVLARRALAAALLAVLTFGLVEQFGRAPSISRTAELARLGRLSASLPEGCASFYVAAAPGRRPIKREYQIDAMLVSITRGVPTLNGYSGHVPPGWSLREVEAPDYEERVATWIAAHELAGRICRLEIGDE
jgi:hypothetical protein